MIKQVRTKNNSFSTVRYDKDGNILTPSRIKELKRIKKNSNIPVKGGKWVKITSQFYSTCCICNAKISIGTSILWNKKSKNTKHVVCHPC